MPGGLNEMVLISKEVGGDDQKVALSHLSRIFTLVGLTAFWFRFVEDLELSDRSSFGVPFVEVGSAELIILVFCDLIGSLAGLILRIPVPYMLGSMILSAVFHLLGLVNSPPHQEIVIMAQIVLGATIGCRFVGLKSKDILSALLLSFGATLILMAIVFSSAFLLSGLLNKTILEIVLAYSPGWLVEMSLVALAMNIGVSYVAVHHVVRILLVIGFAPLYFSILVKKKNH